MKRWFAILLMLALLSMPALAAYEDMDISQLHLLAMDYEFADELDIETAIEIRKVAAEKGHVYSMYQLGEFYRDPNYGIEDYAEAVKWYKMAAEKEYTGSVFDRQAECMLALGEMYRSFAYGMPDPAEAIRWYTQAAELGEEMAYLMLGHLYRHPDYGIMDYPEALKWYTKLADEGEYYSGEGQHWVGHMHMYEDYAMEDYQKAYEYIARAVENGNPGAICELGIMFYYEDFGMQDLAKARECFELSANAGYEAAFEMLAMMDSEE